MGYVKGQIAVALFIIIAAAGAFLVGSVPAKSDQYIPVIRKSGLDPVESNTMRAEFFRQFRVLKRDNEVSGEQTRKLLSDEYVKIFNDTYYAVLNEPDLSIYYSYALDSVFLRYTKDNSRRYFLIDAMVLRDVLKLGRDHTDENVAYEILRLRPKTLERVALTLKAHKDQGQYITDELGQFTREGSVDPLGQVTRDGSAVRLLRNFYTAYLARLKFQDDACAMPVFSQFVDQMDSIIERFRVDREIVQGMVPGVPLVDKKGPVILMSDMHTGRFILALQYDPKDAGCRITDIRGTFADPTL
jgi:hypothetical protein